MVFDKTFFSDLEKELFCASFLFVMKLKILGQAIPIVAKKIYIFPRLSTL